MTPRTPPATEPLEPTSVIAERVAAIRRYLGMTQEALAEAMRALGIDLQRVVVAKLENGRRSFVTVDELLALCVVLEISPVDLLVPKDAKEEYYRIVPNRNARAANAREFIRGEEDLILFDPEPERPPKDPEKKGIRFVGPATFVTVDPIQWMPPDRAEQVERRRAEMEKQEQWFIEHEAELREQWIAEQKQKGTEQ
jgi:transcriptional regulator with XRE-family HTH domain